MALKRIKKGLDIPIGGKPKQEITSSNAPKTVALLGRDYVGMKPTMHVAVGDSVKLGQVLFSDKKVPEIKFTSPGTGKVKEINRGDKRAFMSIVIELEGSDEITFKSYNSSEMENLSEADIKKQLVDSGLWTSLRVRPFSKVADPSTRPNSIFINIMDTNPLAVSMDKILEGSENDFVNGIKIASKLTDGKVFVCKSPETVIPSLGLNHVVIEEFTGPHPAGNVGTHIHFLDPVSSKKFVWYINAQDVISIGKLFTTGKISVDRTVALGGTSVKNPRLLKTRIGASLTDLTENELDDKGHRVISGSVLSGHKAEHPENYLGRYHQQVSVIPENQEKKFLGWLSLNPRLYSVKNIVFPNLSSSKTYNFDTNIHGGKRAIVPSGGFEEVVPLDIIPTYLLRAMAVNDIESAEQLGILELDEEDLALCTFVCPSKLNYQEMLRQNLTIIEKEG
jgi:Na+-transporting NADH:ubiquinone oxidoreductase subunit A